MTENKMEIKKNLFDQSTFYISLIGSFLTIAVYTTAVCYFFYNLNEKSITDLGNRMDKRMAESDQHWREMFMYMSNRIDSCKQPVVK